MSNVLLGLGPFRFSVTGLNYKQLTRRFEYRWEPHVSCTSDTFRSCCTAELFSLVPAREVLQAQCC